MRGRSRPGDEPGARAPGHADPAARRPRIPLSKLIELWERTRGSYWFVPSLMVAGAIALAIAMLRLDFAFGSQLKNIVPWFGPLGAEAARQILSTVASTMVTVAGVVFSITIVALQLASSQFGPRLLRNFMTDLGNQVAFGTFTSAFVYSLLVLAAVRDTENQSFTPVIAVGIGLLLGIVGIGVLIYFIHHIAQSIRIETVVANVAEEFEQALDRIFPETIGEAPDGRSVESQIPAHLQGLSRPIAAASSGYIQAIDADRLLESAKEFDLLLQIERRPGDFVWEGMTLARAYPSINVSNEAGASILASFLIGLDRTPWQDPGFVSQQLTQIALRALSPAINDPFTAFECINRLTQGLRRAAAHHRVSGYRLEDAGRLRVIAPPDTLLSLAVGALRPVARAAGDNGEVVARLLEAVAHIATASRYADDRAGLLLFARSLHQESAERLSRATDRDRVERAYAAVLSAADHPERSPG